MPCVCMGTLQLPHFHEITQMGVKLTIPVWDAILLQEFTKQSVGTTCITYPPVASHINHLRNPTMDSELRFLAPFLFMWAISSFLLR